MLLATAAVLYLAAGDDPTGVLWVLPAAFVVGCGVLLAVRGEGRLWVDNALIGVSFLRCVVIPIGIVSYAGPYGLQVSLLQSDYQAGTLLMAYEIVFVFVAYAILRLRAKGWVLPRGHVASEPTKPEPGAVAPFAGIVILGGAALAMPGVLERYSPFWSEIDGTAREIIRSYNPAGDSFAAISNLGRLAIPGLAIALAVAAYSRKAKAGTPFFALGIALAANCFYLATSRASVFIPLLASLLAVAVLFPAIKRSLAIVGGSGLLLVTGFITYQKSFRSANLEPGWHVNYLSTYLMGPKEYAVGLSARRQFQGQASASTFWADLVGNIPLLSGSVDLTDRTSQFYNWTYLGRVAGEGGGFIAPSSIQAHFYLPVYLAPVACMLGVGIALVAERQLRRRDVDATGAYVASLAMVIGVLYFSNSFSTVLALVALPVLPLALAVWGDKRLARQLATLTTPQRLTRR